jgi:hypothetical protein
MLPRKSLDRDFRGFEQSVPDANYRTEEGDAVVEMCVPFPASIWLCCHCSCVRCSVTFETGASTWTTSWRAPRMMGASAIAADTFRRNFLAATDSLLDRRRCLVDDTQPPIVRRLAARAWTDHHRGRQAAPCRIRSYILCIQRKPSSVTQRTNKKAENLLPFTDRFSDLQ